MFREGNCKIIPTQLCLHICTYSPKIYFIINIHTLKWWYLLKRINFVVYLVNILLWKIAINFQVWCFGRLFCIPYAHQECNVLKMYIFSKIILHYIFVKTKVTYKPLHILDFYSNNKYFLSHSMLSHRSCF